MKRIRLLYLVSFYVLRGVKLQLFSPIIVVYCGFCSSGKFHTKLPAENLDDIVKLRISYQSIVILLEDKYSFIELVYLTFFDTATCFGCLHQPSSCKLLVHKKNKWRNASSYNHNNFIIL